METSKLDNHKFGREHPELWKIVKWMIAGFVSNVPEWAVYMLIGSLFTAWGIVRYPDIFLFRFVAEHRPPDAKFGIAAQMYAYMISTAVGYTIAFILNRKATFHADSNMALSTFLYVLMVLFTIFMNGMVIGPMISAFVGRLPISNTLAETISKFVSMMVPGIWGYPANRFLIHRKKKEPAAMEEAA